MRRVPLGAALQITSLEKKNKKKTRNAGRAQGRQIGRMSPGEGRGEELSRMPGAEARRSLSAVASGLHTAQEDQTWSLGVPRTVCGCAGTCGCIRYLAEPVQQQ